MKRKNRKILMICPEAFRLGWMGATRRLFHLAYAFQELGFNVALLTGKMTNLPVEIEIDSQFPGMVFRTQHTDAYPHIIDISPAVRRAWRVFWKIKGAEYYISRLSYGWAEKLDVNQVIADLEGRFGTPNLIWGVCAGYLAGGTAADRMAKAIGVPWILELQDPPWGCGLAEERKTISKEFKRLLNAASVQVVVTESYRRKLLADFSINPKKLLTIYLTYDREPINNEKAFQDAKWRVIYAGSLSGGRSVAPLLYGLHKALLLKPELSNYVSVEVAGKGFGLKEGKRLSKKLDLQHLVRFHGYVDRKEAEKLSSIADVLVVMQTPETSLYQIPGKVFDCIAFGVPILGIMPQCEAATILQASGLGFIHHSEDVDGIAETLIKLWTDWQSGHPSVQIDHDYVKQFSVESLTKKLYYVLEELL